MSALPEDTVEPVANPFKFLNYFTERDAAVFAGRDAETRAVLAGISAGQTFVLYGPSGVGKSSLLLADVIPRLHARGYRTVYLRVLDNPAGDLVTAVNTQLGLAATDETLPAALASASAVKPVIIVFDQFEEFFTRFEDDKPLQRALGPLLRRILERRDGAVQIVFSLREDYFGPLGDLKNDLPDLFVHTFRLLHLTAFGSRQAIIAPLAASGMTYDAELITLMVDDLAQVDFDPPILQILCTEIFNAAQQRDPGTCHLGVADYYAVGGSHEIFPRYVRSATDVEDTVERLIIFSVLDVLTTERGTKMAMRLAQLTGDEAAERSVYFKASRDELLKVMQHLQDRSIVRRLNADTFELLHDRLVPVVKKAIDQDGAFNRFRNAKRFVAEFTKALLLPAPREGCLLDVGTAGQLMSVQQLEDLVRPYDAVLRLTAAETEFVLRSHMVGQTELIGEWIAALDRFRTGGSEAVIFNALKAKDERVRRGAAYAVRAMQSPRAATINTVLDLALTDRDEMVRRRASATLSHHSEAIDPEPVRNALRVRSHRSHALDLLSELAASEKALPGIGPFNEFRVVTRLRKRAMYEARDAVRVGAGVGAVAGAVAGAVWMVTIGLALLVVIWSIENATQMTASQMQWIGNAATLTSILLVVTTIAGLLVGWRAGAREQKRKALRSRADWLFQPVGGVLQFLFVALIASAALITAEVMSVRPALWRNHEILPYVPYLALIGLIPAARRAFVAYRDRLISGRSLSGLVMTAARPIVIVGSVTLGLYALATWGGAGSDAFGMVVVALTVGVVFFVSGPLIRWTKACLDRESGPFAIGLWSFVCAGLAPLVPLLVAYWLARVRGGLIPDFFSGGSLGGFVAIAFLVLSLTAFVAAVVCVWIEIRRSDDLPGAGRTGRRSMRAAGVVTAVAAVVLGVSVYRSVTPFFTEYKVLEPATKVVESGAVGTDDPVNYHGIKVGGSGPAVITFEYRRDGVAVATAGSDIPVPSIPDFLAFAGQRILTSATKQSNSAKGHYGITVTSHPLMPNGPRLQKGLESVYALCTLNRAGRDAYSGTVTALIDRDAAHPRLMVGVRVIAAGTGEDPADWFWVTSEGTSSEASEMDYVLADTMAIDTAATDTAVYAPTVDSVEELAVPRGALVGYAHPLRTPRIIANVASTLVAVEHQLSLPLVIKRTTQPEDAKAAASTSWWSTSTDNVTALVELYVRPPNRLELLGEAVTLLKQSRAAAPAEREALHHSGVERLKQVVDDPMGVQTVREYLSELVTLGRHAEAEWITGEILKLTPGDAPLYDIFAHAAYGAGHYREAGAAWQRAGSLGFNFESSLCVNGDRDLRFGPE